jgi:hypothetical protein
VQDAVQLGCVAGSKDIQGCCSSIIRDRQMPPDIAGDCADTPMGPRCLAERELRHIQRQAHPVRQPVQHGRQVVAGPSANVRHTTGPVCRGERGCRLLRQHRGDGCEMTRREEVGTRLNHGGGIPASRAGSRQQADIAVARNVEPVTGGACHRAAIA